MEADETKNAEPDQAMGWAAKLSAVLGAGCCVLPIAMMFVAGLVARWVSSFGISDVVWSWIALGVLAATVVAVWLHQLWKRCGGQARPASATKPPLVRSKRVDEPFRAGGIG